MDEQLVSLTEVHAGVRSLVAETKDVLHQLDERNLLGKSLDNGKCFKHLVEDIHTRHMCIVISSNGPIFDEPLFLAGQLLNAQNDKYFTNSVQNDPIYASSYFLLIKNSEDERIEPVTDANSTCHPAIYALTQDCPGSGFIMFSTRRALANNELSVVLLKTDTPPPGLVRWLREVAVTTWVHLEEFGHSKNLVAFEAKTCSSEIENTFRLEIFQMSKKCRSFTENIKEFVISTFRSYIYQNVDGALHALKACYSGLIDILSLMSADKRRVETRLNFVAERELRLFQSLVDLSSRKQAEVLQIVKDSIDEVRNDISNILQCTELPGRSPTFDPGRISQSARFLSDGSFAYQSQEITGPRISKTIYLSLVDSPVSFQSIAHAVIRSLNNILSLKILEASNTLRQDFTGTLVRCLLDLENGDLTKTTAAITNTTSTSQALCQVITSMYRIDLDLYSCVHIFRFYLERIRLIICKISYPAVSKFEIAHIVINSISERKIANAVCRKLSEQLLLSHRLFSDIISQVGNYHNTRIASDSETELALKKEFAPVIALLQLKGHSLAGLAKHGRPIPDKELGRGYYGVVYSCDQWGPYKKLAIKSIVPIDNKHLKDTALEFNANLSIPSHPRIIEIYGCIISAYGAAPHNQKQLLIVMERLHCDLHTMLESRDLSLHERLSIAQQVVEGIRYIHRLGLIHRDIKLRNVLLDENLNAKITDMGFCKPEVLMDGSLVGTPSHMAPELLTAKYDNSVDIYAFGILLWHLLANSHNLPQNYLQYKNPTALWVAVKEGLRPMRPLGMDNDRCWDLTERCWQTEPNLRPTAGEIEEIIKESLLELLC